MFQPPLTFVSQMFVPMVLIIPKVLIVPKTIKMINFPPLTFVSQMFACQNQHKHLSLALEDDSIFYKLGSAGLISFSDYIFLLTVLSSKYTSFSSPFSPVSIQSDTNIFIYIIYLHILFEKLILEWFLSPSFQAPLRDHMFELNILSILHWLALNEK